MCQVGGGKAQMSAGQRPLQHDEIRDASVMPVPQAADQARGPAAADHRGQGGVALRDLCGQSGQIPGQTCPADDGIGPGPQGGADAVCILRGGHHGVYRHKSRPAG